MGGVPTAVVAAAVTGDPMSLFAAMGTVGTNIVIGHFFSNRESERFQRFIEVVNKGIDQRKKNCEKYRQDGFLEGTPTNESKVKEAVESILKKVRDTTEKPKTDFIGYLTVNVFFDEDLDMDTYRQILKDLDELTYRQLCIIRLAILYENREVVGHIDDEKWEEQIPQNERARFHSISRDFEEMMVDESYLDGVRGGKTEDGEPCMLRPSLARSTYQAKRLYSFANLCEIPIEDIVEMFSLWNVRPKSL